MEVYLGAFLIAQATVYVRRNYRANYYRRMFGEVGVAESIELTPVKLDCGGVWAEVKEREDSRAIGIESNPSLLNSLAKALNI